MTHTPSTKSTRSVLIIVIALAALLVAAIAVIIVTTRDTTAPSTTQNDSTGSTPTTDTGTTSESTDADTEVSTITFTDQGFAPASLTVKKGTKVTVTNTSSTRVQFSSDDHPTHREHPELNVDTIGPGESTTFTATTVGTLTYHDHIDDSKTGTLVVTE